jgi:ribA/ribD-fused uncharacterized protein
MSKIIKQFQGEYRLLSNFYPAEIKFGEEVYSTVEHAFQAAKTANPTQRTIIRRAPTPASAKWWGKQVDLHPDWEEIKVDVMTELVRKKFQIPRLRYLLLETGDRELQEGNWWGDRCWGVDLKTGQGDNRLGKILMKIRSEIANES